MEKKEWHEPECKSEKIYVIAQACGKCVSIAEIGGLDCNILPKES